MLPRIGDSLLYTKKGETTGTVFTVQSVQHVDPSHVPNGLVVGCVSEEEFYGYCVFCFGDLPASKKLVCFTCANKLK